MSDFHERWCSLPVEDAQRFVEGVKYAILAKGSKFEKNHLENIRKLLEIVHHLQLGKSDEEKQG